MLRLRNCVQIDLDADLAEHADNRDADLLVVVVAVVRAVQPDREAVRIARLGEQGLGLGRIVGRALVQGLGVAVDARRGDDAGRHGKAAHHDLADRRDIDRPVHGLAHAHVGERVLALDVRGAEFLYAGIEAEEDGPDLRGLDDLQLGVAADPVQILERRIEHEIDLARQQSGDAGRGVPDRCVDDLVDIAAGVLPAPPVLVAHQDGADARLAQFQHVGAGAVGVARRVALFLVLEVQRLLDLMLLRPGRRHDADLRQLVRQDRVRTLGDQLHGVAVDLLRLDDALHIILEVGARQLDAVDGEDDVVGAERRAVMVFHALAQLEFPHIRLAGDGRPARRQGRDQLHGGIAEHQRFVNLQGRRVGRALILRMGIGRQGVALARPFQDILGGGRHCGDREGGGNRRCCHQSFHRNPSRVFDVSESRSPGGPAAVLDRAVRRAARRAAVLVEPGARVTMESARRPCGQPVVIQAFRQRCGCRPAAGPALPWRRNGRRAACRSSGPHRTPSRHRPAAERG